MKVDLSKLPDDANIDKETIVSLVGDIETSYQEKIHYLEEQIRVLKNELFGRKSEKRSAGPDDRQLPIFDSDFTDDQPSDNQKSDAKIVIGAHQRKKAGRKDEALKAFNRCLTNNRNDWFVLGEISEYVGFQLSDHSAALELVQEAIKLNPWYSSWLWNILGDCLFCLNRFSDAHEAYMQANRIDPRRVSR